MEEVHGIGERVLDEHASGIASDGVAGAGACVGGEQDGGLIVAEILDEELAEGALSRTSLLLVDSRGAVFAVGHVEGNGAPRRGRQAVNLGEQLWRASAQGEEGGGRRNKADRGLHRW